MKEKIESIRRFLQTAEKMEATRVTINKEDVSILIKILKEYEINHSSCFSPMDEEKFKQIENALGFELYTWQKTMIILGHDRRTGKTTAACLHALVFNELPIDFTRRPRNLKEDCERNSMQRIYEKLRAAGIKTNPIFYRRRDLEAYYAAQSVKVKPKEEIKPIWKI